MIPSARLPLAALPLAAALLAPCLAAAPPDFLRLTLDGVPVEFHEGDAGPARDSARALAWAAERLQRDTGLLLTPQPTLALARGREEFDLLCGRAMPPWSVAAALPRSNRIILDAGKAPPASPEARALLFHEAVHLALARLETGRADRLPLWLHEGLATWLSGARHLHGPRTDFDLAAAHNTLIPLERLRDTFPERSSEADMAYAQSEAFVAHLVNRSGVEALRAFFRLYADGVPFDETFRAAFGRSLPEAESEWRDALAGRFKWLWATLGALTFWGFMALATVAVFFLVSWRARRQRRTWEREEEEWGIVAQEPEEEDDPDDGEPWSPKEDRR